MVGAILCNAYINTEIGKKMVKDKELTESELVLEFKRYTDLKFDFDKLNTK